jgi:hypothetical protein
MRVEENQMNLDHLTTQMANQAEMISSMTQGVSDEQARWKPDPGSWSILEVLNHLYDEEREDFRAHLDCILHHPDQPWSRIDPGGWVTERRYNIRNFEESLNNFLRERTESLDWLKKIRSPNWQAVYDAPFGRITAGDMLASWVAHDLLHARQLVELHWAYIVRCVHPHKVGYAGPF